MNEFPVYEPCESEILLAEEIEIMCKSLVQNISDLNHEMDNNHPLVRTEEFDVEEYDESGQTHVNKVNGEIWSDAIQQLLDQHNRIYIPYMDTPLYIDKPIVMGSNYSLKVHPETEIRLKPRTNTCMVRNASIVSGNEKPSDQLEVQSDCNITIEGGIWTTLANGKRGGNGNERGHADQEHSIPGIHGVLAFHNTRQLVIRNLVIKESTYFGIHIGNSEVFLVENIHYVDHCRDGIHLDGPVKYGIIRNISGTTWDDLIALNAWDWEQYSVTFGPIQKILVENVVGSLGHVWSEIRMLPGTKRFANGLEMVCSISYIIFRNIKHIHTFKMYDQPNIDQNRLYDRSPYVGQMDEIYFSNISLDPFDRNSYYCDKDAALEICANVRGLYLNQIDCRSISLESPLFKYSRLVGVGPMSTLLEEKDTENIIELFRPEFSCEVSRLTMKNIQLAVGCQIDNMMHVRNQPNGGDGRINEWERYYTKWKQVE